MFNDMLALGANGGGNSFSGWTQVAQKTGRMTSFTYSNAIKGKYYVLACDVGADSSSLSSTPFVVNGADIIGQGIGSKENWGSNYICAGVAFIKATDTTITITQFNASTTPCYGAVLFELD